MGFPKVTDWSDEVYNAGTRGSFNPLHDLERELHRTIPDLRPYALMLCSETDLNSSTQMGWKHMDTGHFDYETVDDFNRAVGLRFGMRVDPHGHIMVGGNYIMIMPYSYRDRILDERKNAYNLQNERANASAAYAHPQDPNASSMRAGASELAERDSTRYQVRVKGEPDREESSEGKRGPGRPRKT